MYEKENIDLKSLNRIVDAPATPDQQNEPFPIVPEGYRWLHISKVTAGRQEKGKLEGQIYVNLQLDDITGDEQEGGIMFCRLYPNADNAKRADFFFMALGLCNQVGEPYRQEWDKIEGKEFKAKVAHNKYNDKVYPNIEEFVPAEQAQNTQRVQRQVQEAQGHFTGDLGARNNWRGDGKPSEPAPSKNKPSEDDPFSGDNPFDGELPFDI